jgi:hypothetical protein
MTYSLIMQYREAAIPVVLQALDLYSNPTNAPSPNCRILHGVSWTSGFSGDEDIGTVQRRIFLAASKNANPAIRQRALVWFQSREEQLKQKAGPSVRGAGKPAPQP